MDNPMIDAYEDCMLSKAHARIIELEERLKEAVEIVKFYGADDFPYKGRLAREFLQKIGGEE